MRIGHGYDVHRFESGRNLIIGGIKIPYKKGLLGHSDADVLIHAIIDSLLGAAAAGDIGQMFPNSDPEFLDASSLVLLQKVAKKIFSLGFTISNIDSTIVAQEPNFSKHINNMKSKIAQVCRINTNQISIKATTEEGLGFTGTMQGIAAHAVSCIE
jgi:2-C-methyl-D-erythritol 2,4-cyclodiphosphate synthase